MPDPVDINNLPRFNFNPQNFLYPTGGVIPTAGNPYANNPYINNNPIFTEPLGLGGPGTVIIEPPQLGVNTDGVKLPPAIPSQKVDANGSVVPPPSLFNTGVAQQGYNPTQYASQAGVNSVLQFLGPQASAGMTYNEGPNAGPPQAIVNWGGENHNAGLVQNLINQFGPEVARRMMDDQAHYHQAGSGVNGIGPGFNWTLQNDPSSAGFNRQAATGGDPNANQAWLDRIAQASREANGRASTLLPPQPTTPGGVKLSPGPTAPPAPATTTGTANTTAAATALNAQNMTLNDFMLLSMLMQPRQQQAPAQQSFGMNDFLSLMSLLMGGMGGGGQQRSQPANRNPLWYSPYY